MSKNHHPVIGITIDYQTLKTYSDYPWYALRENYVDAIYRFGGVPLLIPCCMNAIQYYSRIVDGLIITGGDFDIPPKYYGEEIRSDKVLINDKRTDFEIAIANAVIDRSKPILGICGGEQLISIIHGGILVQDISEEVPNAIEHVQKLPKHLSSHIININANTLLHKIVGSNSYMVNSTHHQAVKMPGKNIVVNAVAADGIIEGIEHKDYRFCLGVQWHPEYCTKEEDSKIFQEFIAYCSNG